MRLGTTLSIALLVAACSESRTPPGGDPGDGGGSRSDTGADPATSQALRAFLQALPGPYCDWLVSCGHSTDRDSCVTDITSEIAGTIDAVTSCASMLNFYAQNRSAIDACLTGQVGACGNDDFDTFCPALSGADVDACLNPADAGVSGGDANRPTLPTQQQIVGAWAGAATCSSGGSSARLEFGWFLCPGNRLRGYEKIDNYDFVDCGTWSVSGNRATMTYRSTAVADPSVVDNVSWDFDYSAGADTLTWVSNCPIVLQRLAGQITEANCQSSACSAGGTGPVQCGTDCDCGRCWYCESGTCRYGGEGPYGCYRGCGF